MQQTNELSTKNASQLLKISVSSMRLYAQTMEAMGYEFKKVDNARRFTKYDLQLISEAMERFKLVGGTMKQALHYTIVKFEQGKEVADAIPTPVTEKDSTPTDLQELQNNMVKQINSNFEYKLENNKNELLDALRDVVGNTNDSEDINTLKEENERLRALYDEIKRTSDELKQENEKLRSDMDQFHKMSMWEFRKWKKDK
ncbi:hypothetical protein FYJ81_12815 [Staphylococcus sp. McC-251-APC-3A2]|uniref:hypothetical protein n=2 Tax=Staphylococcus TaxID=1279 RepID=UPI0012B2A509|nr:hypothetical protein [Staphylococcus sp. McC-251-APC-3A2]MSU31017.1 hypothetical protein [Staphylococcus sp. McC-251-APC-3A2]